MPPNLAQQTKQALNQMPFLAGLVLSISTEMAVSEAEVPLHIHRHSQLLGVFKTLIKCCQE